LAPPIAVAAVGIRVARLTDGRAALSVEARFPVATVFRRRAGELVLSSAPFLDATDMRTGLAPQPEAAFARRRAGGADARAPAPSPRRRALPRPPRFVRAATSPAKPPASADGPRATVAGTGLLAPAPHWTRASPHLPRCAPFASAACHEPRT